MKVDYSPEARQHLIDISTYVAQASSPEKADRFIDAVVAYCESLRILPNRGTLRKDIGPGVRITSFQRRVTVVFTSAPT